MDERQHPGPAAAVTADEAGDAGNSAERLLLFTDAVAAIAITLLVLPLVDIVPEALREHADAAEVITGHLAQIGSFALSFVVIARLWLTHHRVFAKVVAHRQSLVVWNLAWLFAVVVLPFPTEMAGVFGSDRFVAVLYYLNVLAGLVCQAAITGILRAHPAMVRGSSGEMREYLFTTIANAGILVLALLVALAVPSLQYYSLLLLAVVPPASRLRRPRRAAGRDARTAEAGRWPTDPGRG